RLLGVGRVRMSVALPVLLLLERGLDDAGVLARAHGAHGLASVGPQLDEAAGAVAQSLVTQRLGKQQVDACLGGLLPNVVGYAERVLRLQGDDHRYLLQPRY